MTILEALQEEGSTFTSVASKLGLPYAQVRREALAAGVVRRRGHRGRRNHKIDDDQLKGFVADGLGLKAIAEHFRCTKQAVWAAKQRLGLPSNSHDASVATDPSRS